MAAVRLDMVVGGVGEVSSSRLAALLLSNLVVGGICGLPTCS
jgi:hypothetical protein